MSDQINREKRILSKLNLDKLPFKTSPNNFFLIYENLINSCPSTTVKYPSQSDKKIYFEDYPSQSDLKIYFVKYKSQSGWINNSKKHLLY